jgi:hypothetical protein
MSPINDLKVQSILLMSNGYLLYCMICLLILGIFHGKIFEIYNYTCRWGVN